LVGHIAVGRSEVGNRAHPQRVAAAAEVALSAALAARCRSAEIDEDRILDSL